MTIECDRIQFLELAEEQRASRVRMASVEAGQHHGRKAVTFLWRVIYYPVVPEERKLKQIEFI